MQVFNPHIEEGNVLNAGSCNTVLRCAAFLYTIYYKQSKGS